MGIRYSRGTVCITENVVKGSHPWEFPIHNSQQSKVRAGLGIDYRMAKMDGSGRPAGVSYLLEQVLGESSDNIVTRLKYRQARLLRVIDDLLFDIDPDNLMGVTSAGVTIAVRKR